MTVEVLVIRSIVVSLSLVWLILLVRNLTHKHYSQYFSSFWVAFLLWPLLLVYEYLQFIGFENTWVQVVPIIVLPSILLALHRIYLHYLCREISVPTLLYGSAFIVILVLLGVQFIALGGVWQSGSPFGMIWSFWPLYIAYLSVAVLMLFTAISQVEHLQQYHFELPMQVVDIKQYRLKGLTGAGGFAAGMAFFLVILVVSVALGFLPVFAWVVWSHVVIALPILFMLLYLSIRQSPSPSPFNHELMARAPKMTLNKAQAIISQAEAAVIANKSYKKIGLTLEEFAHQAKLEPVTLSLALLAGKKQHFRGFIYQFRMKYAKQVLMGSDAKLEDVAKRLKLGAKGSVSNNFLRYLESKKDRP